MSEQIVPTKGNLMLLQKKLALAKNGYDLLDRKRNILIRETMARIEQAKQLQTSINRTYADAYAALQHANIELGIVEDLAACVPEETGAALSAYSVMGVEIPTVTLQEEPLRNFYGYHRTSVSLDEAYVCFDKVKRLTAQLAEIENGVYRLSDGIRKTQKRANALKNVVIPRLTIQIQRIIDALDEKEREAFSRLKVIKRQTQTKQA